MKVELAWITPEAEKFIVRAARVSTSMENNDNDAKLLRYLMKHQHWSPFELASACFYIECDRAVGRQILRHRSFSFQEFSQRYSEPVFASEIRARKDGATNRQSSVPIGDSTDDLILNNAWAGLQSEAKMLYARARALGVAKEVARAVLPEGLTMSRMFMAGTLRSWVHYCGLRLKEDTQYEHREVAAAINDTLALHLPNLFTPLDAAG